MMRRALISIPLLAAFACTPAEKKKEPEKKGPEPQAGAVKTSTVTAEEAWRKDPPKRGPEAKAVLPSFKQAKLKNGLTVLVADEKSLLPLVSFAVVSKGGAALDAPEKAGLTSLVYNMLGEGAGDRNALQFSDAVADLGASFGASSDRDRGQVSIGGLARNADAMAALLADAVMRPRLEEKDFARRKTQALAAIERAKGSPEGLAFQALPAMIYGAKHPYGHPPTGSTETVKKLTLADVKAMRPKAMGPETSCFIAAGAITLEDAVALAEKHFGGWNEKASKVPAIGALDAKPRKDVLVINKAAAPQTMVLIGRPMFGRGHPDEQAMVVLNSIYGGEFSSRLNMNLREDKGYAYGASSQATFRIGAGVFVAYAAIRQDATAPGLAEFFKELEGLKARPPTEDEVALAKAGIIRGLPGAFERSQAIAGAAAAIFVYDLPLDYYVHLAERYEKVSLEEVRAAAAKYLVPDVMQVLLVGDAKVISGEVGKLKLGKLSVREKPSS